MTFKIGDREIGSGQPPFVVAELSSNHGGKLETALRAIGEAADAGADAIKFQLYDPDKLAERRGGKDVLCKTPPWEGHSLGLLYRQAHTPREWFPELFKEARACGLQAFSSVFEPEDVAFLEDLGAPAYKIASLDALRADLIDACVATGRPVLISNGLGRPIPKVARVHVMQCVAKYPAVAEEYALIDSGLYSDHTTDDVLSSAATARGAVLFEKHFRPSVATVTADSRVSIGPKAFRRYIDAIRRVWLMRNRSAHEPPTPEMAALQSR